MTTIDDQTHVPTDRREAQGPSLLQTGMMIFLASDLMLFVGLFAANFLLRSRTVAWPPTGVDLDVRSATIFTVVLIASSGTLQVGLRAFERRGDVRSLRRWTAATVVLGVAFLINQFVDYAGLGFSPSDHAYGSVYWTLTGLHAFHVTVGVILLCAVLARTAYPAFDRGDSPTAAIGYFWHFVDVVWVAVFVTIFLVR